MKNESGYKLKIVRINNDIKFINDDFKVLLKNSEVTMKLTVIYTPEQNKLSEVQNRVVMNDVRAMLFDSGLTRYL